MTIHHLLVGILSGLYKISNPRRRKFKLKISTNFRDKEVLSENSCFMSTKWEIKILDHSSQVHEVGKHIKWTTYQVRAVGKVEVENYNKFHVHEVEKVELENSYKFHVQ